MTEAQDGKTIIEINGVKLEVDLRTAKRIETLRVGDKVKILHTPDYGSPVVYAGIVVGFEPFESLPTIVVAYIQAKGWGSDPAKIEFLYYNSKSKGYELIVSTDDVKLDKENALAVFARKEKELLDKLEETRQMRDYFERNFAVYWERMPSVSDVA